MLKRTLIYVRIGICSSLGIKDICQQYVKNSFYTVDTCKTISDTTYLYTMISCQTFTYIFVTNNIHKSNGKQLL